MKRTFLSLLLVAVLGAAALAQAPQGQQVRVRGTVASLDGNVMTVNAAGGAVDKITLTPDAQGNLAVREIVKADLSALTPGKFVGCAAIPQPDGTQKAIEIHIFPPGLKPGEGGPRPYTDLGPTSTMTNATVDSIGGAQVGPVQGSKMVLTYPGGQQTIVITPETAIVAYAPGSKADLVAGAHVILFAVRQPDGSLTASNVSVGKNGLVPPM